MVAKVVHENDGNEIASGDVTMYGNDLITKLTIPSENVEELAVRQSFTQYFDKKHFSLPKKY